MVEGKREMKEQIIAYEWYNTMTGHCYVDYIPKVGMDEVDGYTKTPLYKADEIMYVTGNGLDKVLVTEVERYIEERMPKEGEIQIQADLHFERGGYNDIWRSGAYWVVEWFRKRMEGDKKPMVEGDYSFETGV